MEVPTARGDAITSAVYQQASHGDMQASSMMMGIEHLLVNGGVDRGRERNYSPFESNGADSFKLNRFNRNFEHDYTPSSKIQSSLIQ